MTAATRLLQAAAGQATYPGPPAALATYRATVPRAEAEAEVARNATSAIDPIWTDEVSWIALGTSVAQSANTMWPIASFKKVSSGPAYRQLAVHAERSASGWRYQLLGWDSEGAFSQVTSGYYSVGPNDTQGVLLTLRVTKPEASGVTMTLYVAGNNQAAQVTFSSSGNNLPMYDLFNSSGVYFGAVVPYITGSQGGYSIQTSVPTGLRSLEVARAGRALTGTERGSLQTNKAAVTWVAP